MSLIAPRVLLGKGRGCKGRKKALGVGGQSRTGGHWLMSNFSVSGWDSGMPQRDGNLSSHGQHAGCQDK